MVLNQSAACLKSTGPLGILSMADVRRPRKLRNALEHACWSLRLTAAFVPAIQRRRTARGYGALCLTGKPDLATSGPVAEDSFDEKGCRSPARGSAVQLGRATGRARECLVV